MTDTISWPESYLRAFDVEEYYPFTGAGPASLVGKVMLGHAGQPAYVGAKCPVLLFPDTQYLRKVIARLRQGEYPERSPFSEHYLPRIYRLATCDPDGHFHFRGLPALPYIVAAEIRVQDDETIPTGILVSSIRLQPGPNSLVLKNARPLTQDPALT